MSASVNFSVASLRKVLLEQLSVTPDSSIVIAYSGGLDSHVLLHALSVLAADFPYLLEAAHIDHSLQSQSSSWAKHCQQVCDDLSVTLTIRKLELNPKKGESLEAVARDARYAALADCMPDGGICVTAQHRNDQSETLLLQLLRGAGVHGLAAMPANKKFSKGRLIRPLLGFTREDLLEYASDHNLEWVEDDSNHDNRFDRNFLRNEVLPVVRERWPGMDKSLSRSSRHAASAAAMLDEMAREDLLLCKATNTVYFPPALSMLNADLLAELSSTHRLNALRYWVRINELLVPGEEKMESLSRLLTDSSGKGRIDWSEGAFRLDNNTLWLCARTDELKAGDDFVEWLLPDPLQTKNLEFKAIEIKGEGLAGSLLNGSTLRIGFRQGGEQCRMPGDHGNKSLKTLFQDLSVPEWRRDSVPLIFLDDELIAVSSLWSNPHFLPGPEEVGYVFSVKNISL